MGFPISDFWDTTPQEFFIILDGYRNRIKENTNLVITQAYLTSRWVWAKKLPSLQEILNYGPKKEMTDDAMMKMCMALNKLYGGEVKEDGN